MIENKTFSPGDISIVDQALEISEDITCNHYHISTGSWKKYGFEVSHLAQLREEEITERGLAQIAHYIYPFPFQVRPSTLRDYYRICLQDHNILRVVDREKEVALFPLLVYILTHELVHVIRFRKFIQRFEVSPEEKEAEESRVHQTTFEILRPLKGLQINPILDCYLGHRCPTEIG